MAAYQLGEHVLIWMNTKGARCTSQTKSHARNAARKSAASARPVMSGVKRLRNLTALVPSARACPSFTSSQLRRVWVHGISMIIIRTVTAPRSPKVMVKSPLRLVTPRTKNRTVATPRRRPNAELRTREYLTDAEVAKLMKAAGGNRWGHSIAC